MFFIDFLGNTPQWKPKIAIAIADYRAAGPDDIEFVRGDQILVISKPFAEWWEGEVFILIFQIKARIHLMR